MTLPLTDIQSDNARRLAAMPSGSDALAPVRGVLVYLLIGVALWAVLGVVVYFKFFY